MANEMEMEIEMDYNLPEGAGKMMSLNDQMEFEADASSMPVRSTIKKSALSRSRGSMPFHKRKKVSFDATANNAKEANRRTKSLSPPLNRKPAFKQKRPSEEYSSSTATLLPSLCKTAEFQETKTSLDFEDMLDAEDEMDEL